MLEAQAENRVKVDTSCCSYSEAKVPSPSGDLRLLQQAAEKACTLLVSRSEVGPAVPLPAAFVRFGTLRLLFAVAHRLKTVRRNPQLHQEFLGSRRSTVTQPKVVFSRSALIAVPFNQHCLTGVLHQTRLQSVRIPRQYVAGVFTDVALIVVKHCVVHLLFQEFYEGHVRSGRRRSRRRRC